MMKFFEIAPFVHIQYAYDIEKILYKSRSEFQDILVFENPYFGKILVLDGIVQLTERDEFFYHEMLAHVVLYAHPNPKKVVVIGGGDGGTVREVLKHDTIEKVYFVEIDEEVIKTSRQFFPQVACSIDDRRVEIKCMDGAEFIKECGHDIDAVIVDSTDPIGFAKSLFTEEFFRSISNCLKDDGFFVTHSESLLLHKEIVRETQEVLGQVFPVVDCYATPIATYPGNWWTFAVGSKSLNPREMKRKCEIETRYYDDEIHSHVFVPEGLYKKLMSGKLKW